MECNSQHLLAMLEMQFVIFSLMLCYQCCSKQYESYFMFFSNDCSSELAFIYMHV